MRSGLVCVLLVALLACTGESELDIVTNLTQVEAHRLDNEVIIDFDRDGSAYLRGPYWGMREYNDGEDANFVWAINDRTGLEVDLAGGSDLYFAFRCWPFEWDGGPRQRLELLFNGEPVGRVDLESGIHTYSMSVPRSAVFPGRNEIEFAFAFATKPDEVIDLSNDERSLAAAFFWMALSEDEIGDERPLPVEEVPPITDGAFTTAPGAAIAFSVEVPTEGRFESVVDGSSPELWLRTGHSKPLKIDLVEVGDSVRADLSTWAGTRVDLIMASNSSPPEHQLIWREAVLKGTAPSVVTDTSVLLIVADTLRADFVGCYGGPAETPVIDSLAAEGVLFEAAYSHIPITGPSHSSLFTSVLPFEHGVLNNTHILGEKFLTMAEVFEERGYRTAGFISLGVLDRRFGMAQGFEVYNDQFDGDWMRNAEEVNQLAIPWVDAHDEGAFFLMMHYSDPHEPYTPPGLDYPKVRMLQGDQTILDFEGDGREKTVDIELKPGETVFEFVARAPFERSLRFQHISLSEDDFESEYRDGWMVKNRRFGSPIYGTDLPATLAITNPRAYPKQVQLKFTCKENLSQQDVRVRYRQETEYLDGKIGEFLDHLQSRGMLEDTMIIFISDHGEGLGDHKHRGHCSQLYDTLIRVPLIISYPGHFKAGHRVPSEVGLIDILPTLVDYLDMNEPAGMKGRSLIPLIEGGRRTVPVFSETFRPEASSDKKSVVFDGYKYIHSTTDHEWEEMYDLHADPGELTNLRDHDPQRLIELRSLVDLRLRSMAGTDSDQAELTDEDKERLEALGYIH